MATNIYIYVSEFGKKPDYFCPILHFFKILPWPSGEAALHVLIQIITA